ncbi:MAG: VirB3 family type IV secretion system protein [Acidiferrobacterales bacterium]
MITKHPFHRSLIGTRELWGVEYSLAVINLTVALAAVIAEHAWWWIGVAMGVHALLRRLYRIDPDVRNVYARFMKQGHRYEPWPREGARNRRPKGFGA